MKRFLILVAAVALIAPVAALANSSDPASNASKDCAALRAKMGAAGFAQAYASFGACVSAMTPVEKANATSAQSLCTAEQNDANFAASHNGQTFAQFYGTGKSGKNAFGRCVSLKTQASSQVEQQNEPNPAQTCRAERTQIGVSAFDKLFGVNANVRNAFGKCVSKAARDQVNATNSAAQLCMTQESLAGFSTHYGTNANLSNAFGMCVSSTARASEASQQQKTVVAAKACVAELIALGRAGFKAKYATFGACVSAKASSK